MGPAPTASSEAREHGHRGRVALAQLTRTMRAVVDRPDGVARQEVRGGAARKNRPIRAGIQLFNSSKLEVRGEIPYAVPGGRDPEGAIGGGLQCHDSRAAQGVRKRDLIEPDTVEVSEPAAGADPEQAFGGLRDGSNS